MIDDYPSSIYFIYIIKLRVRAVWENIKLRFCCIDRATARSIQQDRGLIFSGTARTNKVSKFFILWPKIYCCCAVCARRRLDDAIYEHLKYFRSRDDSCAKTKK